MIVVDASAALEVLLQTPDALRIEARLFAPGEALHIRHLIYPEIMHGLRRYTLQGIIDERRGQEALEDLSTWPLTRHPHTSLLSRIWTLRHNLSAYDATYVALAETLNAPLVTCDTHLAASTGHHAYIELP